jgi:hypothetical protein
MNPSTTRGARQIFTLCDLERVHVAKLAANAEKLIRLQTWPEGQQWIGSVPPHPNGVAGR